MRLKNVVGADAERIRAGERIAMKRWLAKHGGIHVDTIVRQNIGRLEAKVRERGGDPEPLRLKGRKTVVEMICKERGL